MASGFLSPLLGSYKITTGFAGKVLLGPAAGQQHNALDYGTPVGTPIYATHDAKVTRADGKDPVGGNIITIDGTVSGKQVQSIYAHLSTMFVKAGDTVHAGQIIGLTGGQVGAPGSGSGTTGPHLYFGTKVNGKPVDPHTLYDPFAKGYENFVTLILPDGSKTVFVKPGTGCPTGTRGSFGPYIGGLSGFDACIIENLNALPERYKNVIGKLPSAPGALDNLPIVGGIEAVGQFFGSLGGFVFDGRNWLRMGALTGGAIMAGIGVTWIVKAT